MIYLNVETQACFALGHPVFDPEALKCIAIKQSSCYGVPLHNEVNWIVNHFKLLPTQ